MITPAKWQTAEADQKIASEHSYGEFREKLVPHMREVTYYPHTPEVFSIAMTEGISWFVLDKDNHSKCRVINKCGIQPIFNGEEHRDIRNSKSLINMGNEIYDYIQHQKGFEPFKFDKHSGRSQEVWLTNMTNTGGGGSIAGLFNS